jgi:hypothetical protein
MANGTFLHLEVPFFGLFAISCFAALERNPMISYGSFFSNFQQNLHAAIANIPTFTKRAGGG